ncbi:MAG: oligosaccharide flippase family protein [Hyphomonas sp.]
MLKMQILKGASWLLAGRLASNGLGLMSTLIAARLLMPEDFGLMAVAMSVLAIAGAVVELPVGIALVQMKTAEKADFDTAWTINILRGVIIAALMLAAAWPVAALMQDTRLVGLVAALAAYPLILGFKNSWFEQYIRDMDFRREAMLDLAAKFVSLAVTVWVGYATRSYWALPLGLIASALAVSSGSFLLRPQVPGISLSRFRKFFGFSLWIGLGAIADSLRDASTTFFIGRLLGNAKLGAFAVGSQFGERLELVLYTPMERTLFAAFSSIQEDIDRIRSAYLGSLQAGFAVILPVCAGMGLLAHEIITVALGPGWELAVMVLAVAAPVTAVYLVAGLSNSLTNALGHPRALFRYKLISAVLHIPVLAWATVQFGLAGALFACAVNAGLWYFFSIHAAARVTGLTRSAQVAAIGRSVVSALAMAAAVTACRWGLLGGPGNGLAELLVDAAILALLGALVYAATHLALWHLSGRGEGIERSALTLLSRGFRLRAP